MKTRTDLKKIIRPSIVVIVLSSCLSTAKMSDLPVSARTIDFTKYSTEYHEQKKPFWTSKTSNEYYFEKEKDIPESRLLNIIQSALNEKGYAIKKIDQEAGYVIGKRGMQANEWSSLTGVYYHYDNTKIQLYLKTVITQDATGGWSENRAKKIALIIEKNIDSAN